MPALQDISLKVEAGKFVVIVGPSGCGKTSLLMMLAGPAPPDRRAPSCATARPIAEPDPSRVGVVFQEASLFPWLTALDNTEFPLALRGAPARRAPPPRRADAEPGRAGRLRRALSARAVGRHEAARVDRPRPGAGPAGAADGRAVRRARRADPHDDGPRAAAHLVADAQDRRVHHPQPDRGGLSRRRGAGDVAAARPHHRPHRRSPCRARAPTR